MVRKANIPVTDLRASAGEAASFLRKLANRNRLMIACALAGGERSVSELQDELGIRQPALSQQLAELREAGMIAGRKVSKSVFYRLADARVAAIVMPLHRMFCAAVEPGERNQPLQ